MDNWFAYVVVILKVWGVFFKSDCFLVGRVIVMVIFFFFLSKWEKMVLPFSYQIFGSVDSSVKLSK